MKVSIDTTVERTSVRGKGRINWLNITPEVTPQPQDIYRIACIHEAVRERLGEAAAWAKEVNVRCSQGEQSASSLLQFTIVFEPPFSKERIEAETHFLCPVSENTAAEAERIMRNVHEALSGHARKVAADLADMERKIGTISVVAVQ